MAMERVTWRDDSGAYTIRQVDAARELIDEGSRHGEDSPIAEQGIVARQGSTEEFLAFLDSRPAADDADPR